MHFSLHNNCWIGCELQAVVHGLQPSDDVYTSAGHLLPDADNRWQSSGRLHTSRNVNNNVFKDRHMQ